MRRPLSADEREIGGLGIYMVKTIMDIVSYEYKQQENIVTMIKKWQIYARIVNLKAIYQFIARQGFVTLCLIVSRRQ